MSETWQRYFPDEDIETPLRPVYQFNSPGDSIVLHDGAVGGIGARERPCTVELTFSDKPWVRWSTEPDPHQIPRSTGTVDLRLRRGELNWTMTAHRNAMDGGWINHAEFVATGAGLQRVIVHWINLPNILSLGRIATDVACWNGRWQTEVDGWRITLDRRHDYNIAMEEAHAASLFVLTHVMEVRRVDSGTFDVDSASQLLECFRVCLSFAFGRWVAPALPVGYDSTDQVVWEEWTAPICDPAKTIGSAWLYPLRSDDLAELVKRALPAFLDPARPGITRFQMVSAVQSVETGFVEQRILATFPALENLAWVTLVLGGLVPRQQYKNSHTWPGERRLRRLLERANIPTELDATALPALAAFATAENLPDGPAAVTAVRNRLVHPQTPYDQIYHLDGLTVDAWLLSRHYLTLLILHSIAYDGSYVQLLPPFGWAGDAKPVPWAAVTP